MPKAKNRFERSEQVFAWLKDRWPCGRPVKMIWLDEVAELDPETGKLQQYYGETWRDKRTLIISLSTRKNRQWATMIDTLVHEYVHVLQWGPASLEHNPKCNDHPVAFFAMEGEIKAVWNYDHGSEEANEYEIT